MKNRENLISFLGLIIMILSLSSCVEADEQTNNEINEANLYKQLDIPAEKEIKKDAYAKELLNSAFGSEVPNEIEPVVEDTVDGTIFRYTVDKEKYYIVEFSENLEFPAMVYCFSHLGEDEGFDLAKESSDYFNETLISNARNYVESLYGIDCSNAIINAYGYKNKIAVQLEIQDDQIFHVRFYYKEKEPVGVIFHNDITVFEVFLELYHAKQYI